MSLIRLTLLLATLIAWLQTNAQSDSAKTAKADSLLSALQELPKKYLTSVDSKIDKYTSRITSKTEKTLTKLAKWESKIKTLLEKASPETAQRLFNNNQLSFATALEKYKQGESLFNEQRKYYNKYRDNLTNTIKYLDEEKDKLDTKLVKPLAKAKGKIKEFETAQDNADALEQFIKERKKQLIEQSLQYIGKSKYLQKIDKEAYYYVETIKNYKQLFTDQQKAEETALKILNRIPAFTKFIEQNSMLSSLFRMPAAGTPAGAANLAGLQTRASVNELIRNQIAAGGPSGMDQFRANLSAAQAEANKLKEKLLQKGGGGSSDAELPSFKPNNQKSKTFRQRLEFGSNFQTGKTYAWLPASADIAVTLGYKLNNRSIVGIGTSYKMGIGSLQRMSISHQGIGLRSFVDWQLKKQFYVSGGFEMNYNAQFKNFQQLQQFSAWQQSGLIGLSKKIPLKTKWVKGTNVQLLYDVLANNHMPVSRPVIFRVGYQF